MNTSLLKCEIWYWCSHYIKHFSINRGDKSLLKSPCVVIKYKVFIIT